ncbi:MAG: LPS export ABC transporter periplasmic protein LptC [SAR324 cluster bacterium]|nr:LPS export ABC transporter periplasmic protein LptC [SAR324 cluster bacterium]
MGRLLLFLTFMAFGSGAIYLLTVQNSPQPNWPREDIPTNVLALRKVSIRQHNGSLLKYELFANSLKYDETANTAELTTVRFKVFTATEADPASTLLEGRAEKALLAEKKDTLVLIGKVRMVDRDGSEIHSQRVEFEEKKNRLLALGEVWVKTRNGIHQGDSLVYDIAAQKMTFSAPLFYQ